MANIAPKGTKDLLPSQVYKWHYVEGKFAEICKKYGFKEIRTPMFEHTEVFARGIGDTTDVVQKEMYTFNDHGNRSITLKPEGTSGAVRAFIEHKQYAEVQPTKYYYVTDCFRYEKPQSGRLRHFHQFGVEVFGTPNMLADAEVIAIGHDFLTELGIGDLELRINSVGCPECRKKHREALKAFLQPHYEELCGTCKTRFEKNPMRIIDCKSEICHEIVKDAPRMLDYLCDDCKDAFEDVQANLKALEIPFVVDPDIVRGLDYYTKTAFEFVTNSIGAQGTVCGGGRYDHLIEEVGGPPIPGVGFGLGIERLVMILERQNGAIEEVPERDVYIGSMGEAGLLKAQSLAFELRKAGIKADCDTVERSVKAQMKYANKIGAKYSVILGDSELESGKVELKEMATSEKTEIALADLVSIMKEKCAK